MKNKLFLLLLMVITLSVTANTETDLKWDNKKSTGYMIPIEGQNPCGGFGYYYNTGDGQYYCCGWGSTYNCFPAGCPYC